MANLRTTSGSLLGMFSDTANTVSGVMNTLSGGISILNDKVQVMRLKQEASSVIELETYEDQAISDASLAKVRMEENIRNYIGNDENKQKVYNNFSENLRKKIDEKRKTQD